MKLNLIKKNLTITKDVSNVAKVEERICGMLESSFKAIRPAVEKEEDEELVVVDPGMLRRMSTGFARF